MSDEKTFDPRIGELTPERKKELLLLVIDGLRKKVEDHVIGDMTIIAKEKITPTYEMGKCEPVSIINEGFLYTIEVDYLDPSSSEV